MSKPFFEEIEEEPKNKKDTFYTPNTPSGQNPENTPSGYPMPNSFASSSLISGIISIALVFIPYLSLPLALCAIILGFLSKKGRPMQAKAIIGIILGFCALAIFIFIIIVALRLMQDPEFMKQLEQIMQQQQK